MKTKHIKSFVFKLAKYYLSDGQNTLTLEVDYQRNNHKIIPLVGKSQDMEDEAKNIALDLLKRKHGINFAEPQE